MLLEKRAERLRREKQEARQTGKAAAQGSEVRMPGVAPSSRPRPSSKFSGDEPVDVPEAPAKQQYVGFPTWRPDHSPEPAPEELVISEADQKAYDEIFEPYAQAQKAPQAARGNTAIKKKVESRSASAAALGLE
jgi:hypothetical protein